MSHPHSTVKKKIQKGLIQNELGNFGGLRTWVGTGLVNVLFHLRFPMDLHLVHRSKTGKDIAVVAFQFEVNFYKSILSGNALHLVVQASKDYNHALSPITDQTDYLIQSGSSSSAQTGFRYFSVCSVFISRYSHNTDVATPALAPDLPGANTLGLLHLPRLPDHAALLRVRHLDRVQGANHSF